MSAAPDPGAVGFGNAPTNEAHRAALRSISRVVEETAVPTPREAALAGVLELLRDGPVWVLTGAGASTDSGIPDYRGPRGSLRRHRPMTYQEFLHDETASHRYWARSFVGWRLLRGARPNTVHYALAELEHAGYVRGVVTQNVDGLHTAAGSHSVVDLHGSLDAVACLRCRAVERREALDARLVEANPGYLESVRLDPGSGNPDGDVELSAERVAGFRMVGCHACHSTKLKPDVVYFGEPVPSERKTAARALLADSSHMMVVGSSLAVMSGLRHVLNGVNQGKRLAVINGGPGRADARADILWRTPVRPAFESILDALMP